MPSLKTNFIKSYSLMIFNLYKKVLTIWICRKKLPNNHNLNNNNNNNNNNNYYYYYYYYYYYFSVIYKRFKILSASSCARSFSFRLFRPFLPSGCKIIILVGNLWFLICFIVHTIITVCMTNDQKIPFPILIDLN